METRKGIITIDQRSTYGDAKNRKFFDIQVRIFGQMESSHLFPLLFFYFYSRISLVEPGPVGTSFFANIQNVDSSTADQKTVQLMKNWFDYIKGALGPSISQKGEEIAQCIKEVLLSEKPHYRYLTNDKCFVEQISVKLADFSGDKLQEIMGKHCFGQNE